MDCKEKLLDPRANKAYMLMSPEEREILEPVRAQILAQAVSGETPVIPVLSEKERAASKRFISLLKSQR